MRSLADIPIRIQLILITVMTSAITVLLVGAFIVAYDITQYKTQKTNELAVQAEIFAESVAASLVFNDPKAAQINLNALKANPQILATAIYTAEDELFATYSRSKVQPEWPTSVQAEGVQLEGDELIVFWPVTADTKRVGTVYMRLGIEPLLKRVRRYGGIIVLVILGSLLITLPISMRLHATISNPIREISEAAQMIVDGDLTAIPVARERADEIGILVASFGQMQENLREVMSRLGSSTEILTNSSVQIVATAEQVASGATEAAAEVNQTTATVEEFMHAAQLSADKASNVSENAQKAVQVVEKGNKAVMETVEGINQIKELMASVAESIVNLSEQTQAIGEIITTVTDFAQQSNLLSVNAALEASKAGEQGKGFIVVAQEIRNLADQSKQATGQVRSILKDIHKATSKAVMAAEQVGKAVEKGAQQSSEAGESIRELAETISIAAQAAAQIAASSQQQLAGIEQVTLAMKNIKESAQQNVEGTQRTKKAAYDLNNLGQELKEMIAKYKK